MATDREIIEREMMAVLADYMVPPPKSLEFDLHEWDVDLFEMLDLLMERFGLTIDVPDPRRRLDTGLGKRIADIIEANWDGTTIVRKPVRPGSRKVGKLLPSFRDRLLTPADGSLC